MKFAIHDLTHDQLQIALGALNDAGVPHTASAAPTTPVAPAAPATPEAPAPTPAANAEVDADGVPWDERIHAGSKGKTAKGVWKKRKGLADGVYEQITGELKATNAAEPHPLDIPPHLDRRNEAQAPAAPMPPAPPAAPMPPAPPAAPMPPAPPAAPAPVERPAAQAPAGVRTDITHEQMMAQVNAAISDPNNPMTAADLPGWCQHLQMQNLNDCMNDPVKIGTIYAWAGGL